MNERGRGGVYQPAYRDKRSGELRRSAIWWIRVSSRGKKLRESSHSTRRADAVRLLNRRLGQMVQGRPIAPSVEKTTFSDLERMVLENYRVNGRRSLGRLERSLSHLRAFFGLDRAIEITADRITS